MSNITLPAVLNSQKLFTYTKTDGDDTVHVQSVIPANPFGTVTGTINAVGATVVADSCLDANSVLVTTSGTFSGTIVFEASFDGTSWFSLLMSRASATTQESSRALSGTTLEGWRANLSGWNKFRVRCSAYTSGAASINIVPSALPFEPPGYTVMLAAGSNLIGDVGLQVRTNATGAASIHHIVSAASTGAATIKSAAGRVLGWSLGNTANAWRYVKLHNIASTPTAGSGVVISIAIPPNGVATMALQAGIGFATGIGRTTVTGAADSDATAVGANEIIGDIYYA